MSKLAINLNDVPVFSVRTWTELAVAKKMKEVKMWIVEYGLKKGLAPIKMIEIYLRFFSCFLSF